MANNLDPQVELIEINGCIRHSDIIETMDNIGRKEDWLKFIESQTWCAIDYNQSANNLQNQAIYKYDIERYLVSRKITYNFILTIFRPSDSNTEELIKIANEFFQDEDIAIRWLKAPLISLGTKRPIDHSSKEVRNLINQLKHGFIA